MIGIGRSEIWFFIFIVVNCQINQLSGKFCFVDAFCYSAYINRQSTGLGTVVLVLVALQRTDEIVISLMNENENIYFFAWANLQALIKKSKLFAKFGKKVLCTEKS